MKPICAALRAYPRRWRASASAPRGSSRRRSFLAPRAEERRALALADAADPGAAPRAGLAGAAVHGMAMLEVSGPALGRDEIAKRAAARFDRALERVPHGSGEAVPARRGDAPGAASRMDARAEQGLRSVDVAHA